jgi:acetyltransferase-like isoleucine patch superfamily enzyme
MVGHIKMYYYIYRTLRRVLILLEWVYGYLLFKKSRVAVPLFSKIPQPNCVKIGKNTSFGRRIWIEGVSEYAGEKFNPIIKIGSGVSIGDYCHIGAVLGVEVGDGCLIGSKVLIIDHDHGRCPGFDKSNSVIPPIKKLLVTKGEIKIGKNVWIGDGAVILGGVSIGDGSIVGANCVVTKSFQGNKLIVGNPGKAVG